MAVTTATEAADGLALERPTVRQVTFSEEVETHEFQGEEALPGDTPRSNTSNASSWRYPEDSEKIPIYVQRGFRVKTFGLLSLQQAACLGTMVLVHHFLLPQGEESEAKSRVLEAIYYALSLMDMLCLMQLWIVRRSYPTNYLMMIVVTLISGLLWSLTKKVLMTFVHLQLVAVTTLAFGIASLVSYAFTREASVCPKRWVVPMALCFGWIGGTAVVLTVSWRLHLSLAPSVFACGFVALLLVLLTFETRRVLLACNPDDFMLAVVILNTSTLCIVSVPFFVILYGFFYVHRQAIDEEPPDIPEPEESNPQLGNGEVREEPQAQQFIAV